MKIIHPMIKESWEIEEEFFQACINNNFKKVHQLLTSEDKFVRDTVYQQNAYSNPLLLCIQHGNLKMLKYLTTSPKLEKHFDLSQDPNRFFNQACHSRHIHIIDYLLNSPEIKSYAHLKAFYSAGSNIAATNGDLKTLKYFRELPNVNQTIDEIQSSNSYIIDVACESNYFDIVQYIFDKSKIDNYKDNLNDFEKPFVRSIHKMHLDIVKFFIFDLNMPKTDIIKETIRYLPIEIRDDIENCFQIRDVNTQLSDELPINDNFSKNKKLKV
jgi:hypothetical protein